MQQWISLVEQFMHRFHTRARQSRKWIGLCAPVHIFDNKSNCFGKFSWTFWHMIFSSLYHTKKRTTAVRWPHRTAFACNAFATACIRTNHDRQVFVHVNGGESNKHRMQPICDDSKNKRDAMPNLISFSRSHDRLDVVRTISKCATFIREHCNKILKCIFHFCAIAFATLKINWKEHKVKMLCRLVSRSFVRLLAFTCFWLSSIEIACNKLEIQTSCFETISLFVGQQRNCLCTPWFSSQIDCLFARYFFRRNNRRDI